MPQSQRQSLPSQHHPSSRLTLRHQEHQPLQRTSLHRHPSRSPKSSHRHPSRSPESSHRPRQHPSLLGGAKCLPPSEPPARLQNPPELLRGSRSRLLAR